MSEDRIQLWRIRTPEGVSFSFRLASPALRCVALAIDAVVIATAWSVLSTFIRLLSIVAADMAVAVSLIAYFLLSQGYRMLAEWKWRGQTIGKRVLRLRVVDAQGMRLSFGQIALRNLLRLADGLPFGYLVGGLTALFNRKSQRLGDLAAGTLVIWEPLEAQPDFSQIRGEKYNTLRQHPSLAARLRQNIGPVEARLAWQAIMRRDRLDPEARVSLFSNLAKHFREAGAIPAETLEGVADEQFVRNVLDVVYHARSR